MRLERSLAGTWQFGIDPDGAAHIDHLPLDRTIPVPLPWQAAFPELESYSGYAWYACNVDLDEAWLGGELLLHFGAVDYWAQIYVNGQLVGEHEGGFTPFTFPIRAYVRAGANQIALRVYDSAQDGLFIPRWSKPIPESTQPPFNAINVPHGKQEWYLNVGGIWQDVTLTAVPTTYIQSVRVTPNIYTGDALFDVQIAGNFVDVHGSLRVKIEGAEAALPLVHGKTTYQVTVKVPTPRLWDTENPNLYTAKVSLNGTDEIDVRFGFREISTRDGQLLLNGQPIFLLSALDQDLYPETIYTVPSEDYLRDEFRKAKELGLNNLRCHITPPDPLYLELADEMGLLVWAEIPSWRTFFVKTTIHPDATCLDYEITARAKATLEEMIARDFNHPSLIIWTIVNEDWGTATALRADDRAWLAQMYDLCKQLDPTRLVVDNSACGNSWGPNIHVKSDLDDYHVYTNIPDQAPVWAQTIEQFGHRPLWTYTSHGDSQRTGHEPLILSEFGNWGLPSVRGLSDANGKPPAWFKLGPWWSAWEGEPGWPEGVEDRFERFGLNAIWPDYEAYATATQWHQFQAMKYEIEVMRRQAGIAGYVITELTDAYWESNGLLDFNRCPKVYHSQFAMINAPDVIVPQVYRYATWDDHEVRARLHGAHYSAADWSGAQLSESIDSADGNDARSISTAERGTIADFGLTRWQFPKVDTAKTVEVNLTLSSADGSTLAQNNVSILVLPASAREAAYSEPVAVLLRRKSAPFTEAQATLESAQTAPAASEPNATSGNLPGGDATTAHQTDHAPIFDFAGVLGSVGYDVQRRFSPETPLIVTDYPTADMLTWVREGGSMLYLSSGAGPFFWRQGRVGAYGGAWLASFSWLRPGIYKRLNNTTSPLTLPFMHLMPTGTIVGLPIEDAAMQPDFLAGQISGWVNHPAIHTVQFRYGRGKVIQTTFAFKEALLDDSPDPVGIAMLHDLIDHLTSEACQPTLTANF